MAVVTFGTPVNFMNLKQLQFIARNSGLAYNATTTKADLVTLINT